MNLVPFKVGKSDIGDFVHSFAPAGSSLEEMVKPRYIVCISKLVENAGIPFIWSDESVPHPTRKDSVSTHILIPTWVIPEIYRYMTMEPTVDGPTLEEYMEFMKNFFQMEKV